MDDGVFNAVYWYRQATRVDLNVFELFLSWQKLRIWRIDIANYLARVYHCLGQRSTKKPERPNCSRACGSTDKISSKHDRLRIFYLVRDFSVEGLEIRYGGTKDHNDVRWLYLCA
jgi:hypothetical protein